MKSFNQKVVVVTGAASGMGRSYATSFAAEHARLALCDVDAEGLAESVELAWRAGAADVHSAVVDVSDAGAVDAFAAEVRARLGNAQVVINNAGIEGGALTFEETPTSVFDRVMRVNFGGVVNGTRAFLPQLRAGDEGAIVNISSIFGLVGVPNNADYCASKFAVRGFTEALMAELLDSSISVHLVHPGGIATNIARNEKAKKFSKRFLTTPPDEIVRVVIDAIRSGRPRIVHGNRAFITALGARVMPLGVLARIIRREMRAVL